MPFVTFPAVFLTAASSLLIPEAAQAMAQNDQKAVSSLAARALKLTFLFSIPVACLFFFFGVPLGEMFYQSTQAGQFFRLLAPLTPLWYLDTIVDSLLKGLDQQTPSFLYNTLDAAVRTGLIWLLLPLWGLRGYIVTLFICSIGNAILSLRAAFKSSRCPSVCRTVDCSAGTFVPSSMPARPAAVCQSSLPLGVGTVPTPPPCRYASPFTMEFAFLMASYYIAVIAVLSTADRISPAISCAGAGSSSLSHLRIIAYPPWQKNRRTYSSWRALQETGI